MKTAKRFLAGLSAAILVCAASGCSGAKTSGSTKKLGSQTELPAAGEEVAVLTTSLGEIRIRLFPEEAPKAVENFKGLIRNGYYNGLIFHRVINNFMVQTGDPTGTGRGGESIWGSAFADEFSAGLVNIRGAVAMANSGANTNGSQFFIDQAGKDSFSGWSKYEEAYAYYKKSKLSVSDFSTQYGSYWLNMDKVTQEYRSLYEANGGNPHLDGYYSLAGRGHTVFGQVYAGMDVVDKIAAVSVDSSDKPLADVTILKAEIVSYGG